MEHGAGSRPEEAADRARERPPEEPLADAGVIARRDPGWMSLSDVRVGVAVGFGQVVGRPPRDRLPDAGVAAEMAARAEPLEEPLTRREIEVLGLMAGGRTNRAIAEKLTISPGTVRVHVQHILQKLGVSDRTGAVVRGMGLGLVSPGTPESKGEYSG